MKHKEKVGNRAWKKVVADVAKKAASIEANSTCVIWGYQPKEPKELKKLRKF